MASWTDRYWNSAEGIRLHYRDYAGPHEKPPIICIPGLTRNARDFEDVADRYAGDWRVICVDLRGRGDSAFDPDSKRYAPAYYAADVLKLLDQLGIADAVFFGTSLGGIITMVLADTDSDRIAGAMLNDIGPEIDNAGLDRIQKYVGKDVRYPNWVAAAETLGQRLADVHPRWTPAEWEDFAHRTCREEGGEIRHDYDMRIVDNFLAARDADPIDVWPYYKALAGRPVIILRGESSDLLSEATAERMAAELPGDAELVLVRETGHAPNLDEPEAIAAMDRLLTRVMERRDED